MSKKNKNTEAKAAVEAMLEQTAKIDQPEAQVVVEDQQAQSVAAEPEIKVLNSDEVYEVHGKDLRNGKTFLAGWRASAEGALALKAEQEAANNPEVFEFSIKYPADKSF